MTFHAHQNAPGKKPSRFGLTSELRNNTLGYYDKFASANHEVVPDLFSRIKRVADTKHRSLAEVQAEAIALCCEDIKALLPKEKQ